jgi:hypothetical protein
LPLAAGQVDAAEAAERFVAACELREVVAQRARVKHRAVFGLVGRVHEEDVVPNGEILDPGGLHDDARM